MEHKWGGGPLEDRLEHLQGFARLEAAPTWKYYEKTAERRKDSKGQRYKYRADDGSGAKFDTTGLQIGDDLDHDKADDIVHHCSTGKDNAESALGESTCLEKGQCGAQAGRAQSGACCKCLESCSISKVQQGEGKADWYANASCGNGDGEKQIGL